MIESNHMYNVDLTCRNVSDRKFRKCRVRDFRVRVINFKLRLRGLAKQDHKAAKPARRREEIENQGPGTRQSQVGQNNDVF